MPYCFKLSRRISRLRAPALLATLVAFGGCESGTALDPSTTSLADPVESPVVSPVEAPSTASASFNGLAFGAMNMPTTLYGSTYTGGKQTYSPGDLKSALATIKSRGGRVVIMMAGPEKYYKDASGHFSLTRWKERIDRFKSVNFDSYISDGTIIGHYMIDEPQDPHNWNGQPIAPSTVDEMGRYSKQLWPGMATIVRTLPKYFPSSPKYVDAAWAQYLARFGSVNNYIQQNVSDAQKRGLALVVGLNVIMGGAPNGTTMSASEVKAFGSALLSNSYPCAFLSWQYRDAYWTSSATKDAMQYLSSKARSRSAKSCRS